MLTYINNIFDKYDKGEFEPNIISYKKGSLKDKEKLVKYLKSSDWKNKLIELNRKATKGRGEIADQTRFNSCATTVISPLSFDEKLATDGDDIWIGQISTIGFYQMNAILNWHPFTDGNKRTAVNAGINLMEYILDKEDYFQIKESDQKLLAVTIISYFELGKPWNYQNKIRFVWDSIINYSLIGEKM